MITRCLTAFITHLAAIAAPIAAAVTLFRQQVGTLLKSVTKASAISAKLAAYAAMGMVIWLAGAAVPLLIWIAYLYLSYWGIAEPMRGPCELAEKPTAQSVPDRAVLAAGSAAGIDAQSKVGDSRLAKSVRDAERADAPATAAARRQA